MSLLFLLAMDDCTRTLRHGSLTVEEKDMALASRLLLLCPAMSHRAALPPNILAKMHN